MARQNNSPLKQQLSRYQEAMNNVYSQPGIWDESNVIAPVKYEPFVGDFSTDAVLEDAKERRRTSTGLKGLELKLSKTKPGSPEHIRLKSKLDKKNFNREKKSIKKMVRKYGEDADFSNISTEFMENLDTGGTVGDKARRTKKQVDRFLDRNQSLRSIFTDKVDRRDVYNEGIKDRDAKLKAAADKAKADQDEIDKRINNKSNFSGNNILFPESSTSSIYDRRWDRFPSTKPKWSIAGSTTNPTSLYGQFNIYDALNTNFGVKDEGDPPRRGEALYKKRPFISHTESITAGKPIGSLMKKFR